MSGSAPTDFLTLAGVKAWLNITDTSQDAMITLAIPVSTSAIINELGWDPNSQTVTEYYDGNGSGEIIVNGKNVTAISAINVINCAGTAIPLPNPALWYIMRGAIGIGVRMCRFPHGNQNIQVTYTRGYSPIPADLILAAQMTFKAIYVGKDVDQHTEAEAFEGVISAPFWPGGPGSVPPQALSYLRKYKLTMRV